MIRKLLTMGKDFAYQMKKQNISAFAASTAFFLFLSIPPMLIVLGTIIPYTPLTRDKFSGFISDFLPEIFKGFSGQLLEEIYSRSNNLLPLAVLITLFTAGKGVLALMRGLNAINGVVEERNYFVVRIISTIYTFVMIIVVVISVLILVLGDFLVKILLQKIPGISVVLSLFLSFRFLLSWILLSVLFAFVYAYVPNKSLKFKDQISGASVAAVLWNIFSFGFSVYMERNTSYSLYGSLSIIIIFLIWLYFCMYIIMIGAYLNQYLKPVKRIKICDEPREIGKIT